MSLISRIFSTLFAKKKNNNTQTWDTTSVSFNKDQIEQLLYNRDQEKNKRIKEAEDLLKQWIVQLIKEKDGITFTWESGNDEAFVTFKDKNEADENKFWELESYIIDKLDIPDAGEFSMNGEGKIYILNYEVRAKYSSTMKALIDFDEETETEIYSEEEHDSGDKVLFNV
jgi:hypothetical protein